MQVTWLDLTRLARVSLTELSERSGYPIPYVRQQLEGNRPLQPRLQVALEELRVGERAVKKAAAIVARSPHGAKPAVAAAAQAQRKFAQLLASLAGQVPPQQWGARR